MKPPRRNRQGAGRIADQLARAFPDAHVAGGPVRRGPKHEDISMLASHHAFQPTCDGDVRDRARSRPRQKRVTRLRQVRPRLAAQLLPTHPAERNDNRIVQHCDKERIGVVPPGERGGQSSGVETLWETINCYSDALWLVHASIQHQRRALRIRRAYQCPIGVYVPTSRPLQIEPIELATTADRCDFEFPARAPANAPGGG